MPLRASIRCVRYTVIYSGVLLHHDGQLTHGCKQSRAQDYFRYHYRVVHIDRRGGYLIGGGNNYAAKVNDQEISRGQFENAFNSERNRMQQQLGDQYSELAANEGYMKTLRQQVLNRLIDEALLDQYARELKLGISDEQVKQAIFATPAFQVDGKFDNSRYNGILNQMGMTADQYARRCVTSSQPNS